jgi:Domain of unknown function (DUF4375)
MRDDDFELIDSIFCRLTERKRVFGPRSLTVVENIVLSVWHASGIIENGGLQYFYEQDLDPEAVADAYQEIGCSECAEVLRLSWSLFPDRVATAGRDARVRFVEDNRGLFDHLDHRFWKFDKRMQQRLAGYIRTHECLG